MKRQAARSWRATRRDAPLRRPAQDEEPSGERVRLVRWGRIWAGLAMIVVAIVWLAVDNALGLYTRTPVPAPATNPLPILGTAQSAGTYSLNAKQVGSYPRVAGRPAPAGQRFLVIAVQLVNRSSAPIAVQPRQFTVHGTNMAVPGVTYPGQKGPLFARPIAPGVTADGFLLFLTATASTPTTLVYTPPHGSGAHALSWRFS